MALTLLGVWPMSAGASPPVAGNVTVTVEAPGATADAPRAAIEQYLAAADPAVSAAGFTLPAGARLRIAGLPGFVPEPLPGFGAVYGAVRAIIVNTDGQRTLAAGPYALETGDWVGIRNRYRALVVSGLGEGSVEVAVPDENEPELVIGAVSFDRTIRLYAGPIQTQQLRAADPVLTHMLFAALWNWLRWLCFGMLWLLTVIDGVVGNIGWSIVLLSLAVKVLMTPLTWYADRLQASVNRTQALLQPLLADIRRNYRGEEAHERTLAAYREHGVSPMYPLKSLAGFLIQIPVFIAAFDMLGDNIALDGAHFWWIDDLSHPDHLLALPFTMPFFGGYLNLLPVLMTAVTFLTSWLQTDPHLTPALMRAQQRRLYWMAGAFFLLFYTFPAGMVLYWTTNNVVHLAKIVLRPPRRAA